jgi:hypothetical protein
MGIRFGLGLLAGALALSAQACGGGGSDDPTVIGDAGPVGGSTGGAGGEPEGGSTGGAGGEPVGGGGGAGGLAPDVGVPDMGTSIPCPEATGYGYIAAPVALTSGAKANHSPRAVWTGSEWAVTWFSVSEVHPGLGNVKFQRFNTMGQPVGDLQDLGLAEVARFDVVYNGGGFLIAWLGAKDAAGNGFKGLRIQALAADGSPVDVPTDLAGTFDAERLSLGFAPLTGGMLVYTRGRNGADGVYAQPLGEGGERAGEPVRLTAAGVAGNYPAVAYGDGTWGVAWSDATAPTPSAIVFKLLNERAQVAREGSLPNAIGAKGAVFLAYGGSDTFGLAWNQEGEGGIIRPKLTLLSASDASVQVSPDVTGPEGFAVVTDLAWHDPNFFGVAWQDTVGGLSRIGLTRIDPLGVSQPALPLDLPAGQSVSGLSPGGTVSNLGAFFTADPDPVAGGFSDGAQVHLSRLGACR